MIKFWLYFIFIGSIQAPVCILWGGGCWIRGQLTFPRHKSATASRGGRRVWGVLHHCKQGILSPDLLQPKGYKRNDFNLRTCTTKCKPHILAFLFLKVYLLLERREGERERNINVWEKHPSLPLEHPQLGTWTKGLLLGSICIGIQSIYVKLINYCQAVMIKQ